MYNRWYDMVLDGRPKNECDITEVISILNGWIHDILSELLNIRELCAGYLSPWSTMN